MDHPDSIGTELNLIVRRIPEEEVPEKDLPPGFRPLRLNFLPGRLSLELLRPKLILGRHSQADIRLSLPDVSRRHCQFFFSWGNWTVADLGSLNGIYLNGDRIQEAILCSGDVLRIGSLNFGVKIAGELRKQPFLEDENKPAAVLKSIADILPKPKSFRTERYRRAS